MSSVDAGSGSGQPVAAGTLAGFLAIQSSRLIGLLMLLLLRGWESEEGDVSEPPEGVNSGLVLNTHAR